MDVTQLLEQDHRAVEKLFGQYDESGDQSTLVRICQELKVHTVVEEEIVYPRLAQLDRQMEEHAAEEHAEAKELIAQIEAGDPDASKLARQLEKAIQDHVQEEESEAFPLMRDRIPADDLSRMGDEASQRKQELMKQ
jgi:hemerythrin superfamily protein